MRILIPPPRMQQKDKEKEWDEALVPIYMPLDELGYLGLVAVQKSEWLSLTNSVAAPANACSRPGHYACFALCLPLALCLWKYGRGQAVIQQALSVVICRLLDQRPGNHKAPQDSETKNA